MSSYSNRGRGGSVAPSRPLIARPQSNAPQQHQQAQYSALGSSIAGALSNLGGMLPGHAQPGYAQPWPAQPIAPHPGQHPAYAQQFAQQGYPQFQHPQSIPAGAYGAGYLSAPGAFPSAHFPPQGFPAQYAYQTGYPYFNQQQQQAYAMPQATQHLPPAPIASTSQAPRTNADGYTISSAYTQQVPGPSKPQQGQGQGQQQKKKQKGGDGAGGAGGGKAGGDQPKKASGAPPASRGPEVAHCQLEGCTFSGRPKAVREHEEDRHLIYAPGREPKPWVGSYKAIDGAQIEGTTITLDSPEAVAKWIEERKKRWPSNKVVEEKAKLYPESAGRGRGRGGRGGRGMDRGGRGRGGRLSRPNGGAGGIWGYEEPAMEGGDRAQAAVAALKEADDEPPHKKVKLDDTAAEKNESQGAHSDAESDKDHDDDQSDDDDGPPVEASSRVPVPALFPEREPGEDEEVAPAGRPSIHPSRLRAAEEGEGAVTEEADASRSKSASTIVCRYFKQKGRCTQGDACPFLHSLPNGDAIPPPLPKRKRPAPPPAPHNPFARADPFAQLAERDWSHVVSDALQAIEFLEGNDWLKGVELRVGQIEEEGGIEVLQEVSAQEEEGLKGGKEAGIEEVEEVEEDMKEQVEEEANDVQVEGGESDDDAVMDSMAVPAEVAMADEAEPPAAESEDESDDGAAQTA